MELNNAKEKISNLFLRSRHQKKYAIILIVLLLSMSISFFVLNRDNTDNFAPEKVEEPDAPKSEKVLSAEVSKKKENSSNNQNNSGNNSSNTVNGNNGSNENPNSTPTEEPNTENNTFLTDLGNIRKLAFSPDKTKMLVLSSIDVQAVSKNESNGLLDLIIPKVSAQEAPDSSISTLSLTDAEGNVITTISENNVLNAEFFGNNYVYYQVLGTGAGVYRYDINGNKKDILVYSYDPQAFNNITPIDDTRFFFIQPNTGKMGFGEAGNTNLKVIEEKLLNTSGSYTRVSAFKFASVSPDKNYIAVYDSSINTKSNTVRLKIYPTTAQSATDIYFETDVVLVPNGMAEWEKIFEWSDDSKYLVAGDNATIIDVTNKSVAYTLNDAQGKVKVSPNKTQLAVKDVSNEVYITDFTNSFKTTVAKDISQFEWLSDDLLLAVIGQRLYVFNITAKKLESVNDNRAELVILDVNETNGVSLVRQGDKLIEITKK